MQHIVGRSFFSAVNISPKGLLARLVVDVSSLELPRLYKLLHVQKHRSVRLESRNKYVARVYSTWWEILIQPTYSGPLTYELNSFPRAGRNSI
jgi:hypothetical protein